MGENPAGSEIIVAVFPAREDRVSLDQIFASSNWNLHLLAGFQEARTALGTFPVGVVISDARLSDGHCWKDLLHEIQGIVNPPPLIVVDRLADEALWAEVLNLGAYDLLAKPFHAKEVLHAVTMAYSFWRREREGASTPAKPPQSAHDGSRPDQQSRAASGDP
ncbi:MAG TPA: response regulator [Bryobacteraceae bacterium]|nr:response regulator [Bryobacteraceae bacterium]